MLLFEMMLPEDVILNLKSFFIQCSAVPCSAVPCSAVPCSAVPCSAGLRMG